MTFIDGHYIVSRQKPMPGSYEKDAKIFSVIVSLLSLGFTAWVFFFLNRFNTITSMLLLKADVPVSQY